MSDIESDRYYYIESDRYYVEEAGKLKRLSRWEQSFIKACSERLADGIQLSPGQRTKLQQIILDRSV